MLRMVFSVALACTALFAAASARAQPLDWSLTIGSGGGVGVYVGTPVPAQVYVPAPVYRAPPVVYAPVPVYRPVQVYQRAWYYPPAPVYVVPHAHRHGHAYVRGAYVRGFGPRGHLYGGRGHAPHR